MGPAAQPSSPPPSRLSLLRLDHGAAHVVAAVGTRDVRRLRRPALRASLELLRLHAVVRAALAGAGIGVFAFRDGHGEISRRAQAHIGQRELGSNPPNYRARHSRSMAVALGFGPGRHYY
jgi:hypothetical protein